ncbi:hypothetical protein TELCIR_23129, partial [Teladorsagia circumcincta]
REYRGQDGVHPSPSEMDRTRNEYMTGEREYSSRSKQKVIDGDESSHHLGERNRMLYRTKVIPELKDGGTPRFGAKSLGRGSMKRRHRPGALALKEIRRLQKSTHILIPRLPLQRVMREVVRELYPQGEYRFTVECCEALQE